MANCSKTDAPTPQNKTAPQGMVDWVIDGKRITFKGMPIPFGKGILEFEKLLGPASDSMIRTWEGHKNVKIYYWDNLGLKTEILSDRHPDLIGGMQIFFREAKQSSKSGSGNRRPKGSSRIELKPHGEIDSASVEDILLKGFHSSSAFRGDNPQFLELELEKGYWISIIPERGSHGNFQSLSIHLNTPDIEAPMSYPELISGLEAAAGKSKSGKETPEESALRARLESSMEAAQALEEIGFEKIASALKKNLDFDSTKAMMDRALDSIQQRKKAPQ